MNNVVDMEGKFTRGAVPSGEYSSGGGDGGDMERRLSAIEAKLERLDDRNRESEKLLAVMNERLAHLPSKGFIVSVVILSLAVIAGIVVFVSNAQVVASGNLPAAVHAQNK